MSWLRIKDAALYSGVSVRTLRGLLKAGLRHSRLPSGTILIRDSWIDDFLSAREVTKTDRVDGIVEDILRNF